MDAQTHIFDQLVPIPRLRYRQETVRALHQQLGDKALAMHPASILAAAHQALTAPIAGNDGFDDLRWQVSCPDGLPKVRFDLVIFEAPGGSFDTNAPFQPHKVETDFDKAEGIDAMAYSYLLHDLDDEDRNHTLKAMASDAEHSARLYIESMHIRGWHGWDALMRDACARGDQQAVRDALSIGIPVSRSDARGNTPLHVAASHGHGHLVQPLIEAGAIPNAQNADGKTPLHLGAENKWAVACMNLMAHGADPNARDHRGRTPTARQHVQVFAPSL